MIGQFLSFFSFGLLRPRASSEALSLEERWQWFQVRWALRSPQVRTEIYERFLTFAPGGMPLDTIVRSLLSGAQEEKSYWFVFWRDVARRMISDTLPFSQAIGRYLPSVERVMLSVGDASGQWDKAFSGALFVCSANAQIRGELRKQLVYPIVLLLALVAMLIVIASEIAPQLEVMLDRPKEEWPLSSFLLKTIGDALMTQGLWAAAGAAAVSWLVATTLPRWIPHTFSGPDQSYGRKPLVLAAAAVIALVGVLWYFGVFGGFVFVGLVAAAMAHPRTRGHVRAGLDQSVPPWSIYREYQAASYLIAMAALVGAGRPFDSALRDIAKIASPWLQAHLHTTRDRAMAADRPGDAMNTGLLSREVSRYIRDFDRMGAFNASLDAVGVRGVARAIKRVSLQAGALRFAMVVLVMVTMMLVYAGVTEPGYLLYTESQQGGAIR